MLNSTQRGACSELLASAWLLEQGYEVFRNVAPSGPFDLIAICPGETVYVDVKTCTPRKNYGEWMLAANRERPSVANYPDLNCRILYVYGSHVGWSLLDIPFNGETYSP